MASAETHTEDETTPEQLRWAGLQLERLDLTEEEEEGLLLVSGSGERPGKAAKALRAAAREQGLGGVAIVEAPPRDRFSLEVIELPAVEGNPFEGNPSRKGAQGRQLLLARAQNRGTRQEAQKVLREVVASLGREDVAVVVAPFGVALDQVSEDVMHEHGWVRAEDCD